MSESCPLCHFEKSEEFHRDKKRQYLSCPSCKLVFVSEDDLLDFKDEVALYGHHENIPEDKEYQKFLNKLLTPLQSYLTPKSEGIDFGCGPGPTISYILEKLGHDVVNFDPYFFNDTSLLDKHYDFVTCSEVIEHVFWPKTDFLKMLSLVKGDGTLGIMTQLLNKEIDFSNWWYKNDPTHVRFYSKETFQFLANKYLKRVKIYGDSVVIFY